MSLNKTVMDQLESLGFSKEALSAINKCTFFADMLTEFIGDKGGQIIVIPGVNYSSYRDNTIRLGGLTFNSDNQFSAVSHLAHEIGHALAKVVPQPNVIDSYLSANEYATDRNMNEGQAILNQFRVLKFMYPEMNSFNRGCWNDNESVPISAKDNNLFDKINAIVFGAGSDLDKVKKLAVINSELAFARLGTSGVGLTYDEYDKWNWLKTKTDIAVDYMEAFGIVFFDDENGTKKTKAINVIENSQYHSYNIKVLVNQAHKTTLGLDYFGTSGEDIFNIKDGSVLGQADENEKSPGSGQKYEILWGGNGNDELYGSKTQELKEILLGGVGNDHLYGYGGDDRLAGNEGDDHLHGGSGVNYLYGGAGKDTYYIGEGIDIINDPDRDPANASVIMWNGKKLDKIYWVSGNLYKDFNGLSYYNYGSRMLVFQPGGGLIASLEGFDFLMQRSSDGSNYGLTLVDDNPLKDLPMRVMPGTNPGLGGDVYHTINSSASQKDQYVGIISGSKDDLFTGGYGNEVVDMGAGNGIVNGGLGHDVIDGGSQYSWAA